MKFGRKAVAAALCASLLATGLSPVPAAAAEKEETGGMQVTERDLQRRSPIDQPYEYVSGGQLTEDVPAYSPDPLVGYRWENTSNNSLQIYVEKPVSAVTEQSDSFAGLESACGDNTDITVTGPGTILLDFGTECAGWLEIDSPDLSGEITLGISEYNQPAFVMVNNETENSNKTIKPVQYGDTYRLELNAELYEGVRYGFINVTEFDKPFHITDVRLICQTKRVNYNGSFDSDNEMLNKIWYTAAYDVRVNLKEDYFAAILMDRGDRFSWTGDAYPAQAAALAAFGNYDFVLQNLHYTSQRGNGIESYELYWIFSLIDYYRHTGDREGVEGLLSEAVKRLDHAYEIYGTDAGLGFFGWDERLGAGFENPDTTDNRNAYKLLCIEAWDGFSDVLRDLGHTRLADTYAGYAEEKAAELREEDGWYEAYGLHTAADAINADVLTEEETAALYEKHFTNRVNRLSYSPFNQYFIIQAMAAAGEYDDALSTILDMWGGQIEYGGTTFFETYRPQWNAVIEPNGPVPNSQVGYTSLAHPWSAGVLAFLSEEILGIQAAEPGFKTFSITPHLGRQLTRVSGEMPTPYGTLSASFDTGTGVCSVTAPAGTGGTVGIPKAEKTVESVTMDGQAVTPLSEDADFLYFQVSEGSHTFQVAYEGQTPAYTPAEYVYPASFVGEDRQTQGNWEQAYGSDGFLLCSYNEDGTDFRQLPDYVDSIHFNKAIKEVWGARPDDPRALVFNPYHVGEPRLGAYRSDNSNNCGQSFTVDIDLNRRQKYTVALYFVDLEKEGRQMEIEMYDGETLNLVAPVAALRDYKDGVYLIFEYDQSARFRIHQVRGTNVVLSGIFFGGPCTDQAEKESYIIDNTNPGIQYTGTWEHNSFWGDAYQSSLSYSAAAASRASYTFRGTGISYYASTEFNRGMVEIILDGESQGIFDLYDPVRIRRQQLVFTARNLQEGEHTIQFVATGEKNPAATGAYVDIDALEVYRPFSNIQETVLDDQDPAVQVYGDGWARLPFDGGTYMATFSHSNIGGAYVELEFEGTGISYIASKEFNRGVAEVFLDGESQGEFDLYSAAALRQQEIFAADGLEMGRHVIRILVTGRQNPAAAGTYVDLDAFKIRRPLYTAESVAAGLHLLGPAAGETQLMLPPVPDGFRVEIAETSLPAIIDGEGYITPPLEDTTVTVTLQVTGGRETARQAIDVLVPAGHVHDWQAAYTVDKEPTCTEEGSQSIHCASCEAVKDVKTIPALGHDWQAAYTVDKEPTCTEEGSRSIHCASCEAVKDVKAIPATGHAYGDWVTDRAPTLTEPGLRHRICSRCGDQQEEKIPAQGFTPGDLDGNGAVDIQDVMAACRILARQNGGIDPTADEIARGDLTGDGYIRIDDIMAICRLLAQQNR